MKDSGYNLRNRSLFTTAPTTNGLATIAQSGTAVTVYSVPTMTSQCQETIGSDSARGISTVAEPIDSTAASSLEI